MRNTLLACAGSAVLLAGCGDWAPFQGEMPNERIPFEGVKPMSRVAEAQWAGEVTVVELWGTWCPPCMRTMPHVQELWEEHAERDGFRMVVLNTAWRGDTLELVEDWQAAHSEYTFPVYFEDRELAGQLATRFSVNSIPRMLVFDKDRELRYNGHPMEMPDSLLTALLAE